MRDRSRSRDRAPERRDRRCGPLLSRRSSPSVSPSSDFGRVAYLRSPSPPPPSLLTVVSRPPAPPQQGHSGIVLEPTIGELQELCYKRAYRGAPERVMPWRLSFVPRRPGAAGLQGPTRAWAAMGAEWAYGVSRAGLPPGVPSSFGLFVWVGAPRHYNGLSYANLTPVQQHLYGPMVRPR